MKYVCACVVHACARIRTSRRKEYFCLAVFFSLAQSSSFSYFPLIRYLIFRGRQSDSNGDNDDNDDDAAAITLHRCHTSNMIFEYIRV